MEIRKVEDADLDFLKEMLYAALFWRPTTPEYTFDTIIGHPALTMFYEGWGRPGDVGYVAEGEGRPIGAVWYRLFTEEVHGEGWVDPSTPELAIAVVDGFRGRGIGRKLMETIHEHAGRDGIKRISLSVNDDNPAKRLYASLGYRDVPERKELMVLDLA